MVNDESSEAPVIIKKPMTERDKVYAQISKYLKQEPRGIIDELEFNDDFWLQPSIRYWPS